MKYGSGSVTGAYTDTRFGIFHLLGYQFSPRLADIGGSRFWRVDQKADYGVLNALAAQQINTTLIIEHWEDLLRLAGSLKLGTVQASGLIRTLQTKDRPTRLARALEEVGRLVNPCDGRRRRDRPCDPGRHAHLPAWTDAAETFAAVAHTASENRLEETLDGGWLNRLDWF